MVIRRTTSNPTITAGRKLNESSNSVETAERCSTDGTDPGGGTPIEASPAARSSRTNSTEPALQSSAVPLPRPGTNNPGKACLVPSLPHHPVLSNDITNISLKNNIKDQENKSGDGVAICKRTSSLAQSMNSISVAGSGQPQQPLVSQTEARWPPLAQESTPSLSGKSVKSTKSNLSASKKSMIPRHPESKRTASVPPVTRNKLTAARKHDLQEQEQALFEQKICEDPIGVAIRKINQYGKSNLRYVRCITVVDANNAVNRSVGSWVVRRSSGSELPTAADTGEIYKALSWGKKKDVQIALRLFTAVRKGKTTDRARRNQAPANRILSLITVDPYHPSLDIEAPTVLDRDKFARAFARFLNVPMQEEDSVDTIRSADPEIIKVQAVKPEESSSLPGKSTTRADSGTTESANPLATEGSFYSPRLPPSFQLDRTESDPARDSSQQSSTHRESDTGKSNNSSSAREITFSEAAVVSLVPACTDKDDEENSHVSSLTGHGYDHELVEELHNALNELRTELEDSRAEAARAVKVAEQAIQSAEKSNSIEWQNTVTHKAAEAAAMAQKRSASAMAKQRLAEERLEGERRAAAFWRKQAGVAEEEAGALQTRAAAAEVQRAAMGEQLEWERRIVTDQIAALRARFTSTDMSQREALEAAMERNRALEMELDATRRDLQSKNEMFLDDDDMPKNRKAKRGFGRKKKGSVSDGPDYTSLLSENSVSSSSAVPRPQSENQLPATVSTENLSAEQVLKVYAETQLMRQQFEMLKRATADQFVQLPEFARLWGEQISQTLLSSQSEVARLQEKLAMESASRRKLLQEVQDLRGAVRVYCRPRPCGHKGLVSLPSHDTIMLHREKFQEDVGPISFEFDRVFDPHARQQDVYTEVEEVCLGVLDGYNICLMTYGPSRSGKTCTLLGDLSLSHDKIEIINDGIHLKAMKQLFTIAHHRNDRYKDTFTLTIIEVHNDRIRDLVAATQTGECKGQMTVADTKSIVNRRQSKVLDDDASSGRPSKLEIRTDLHGDTVIQGLVSVEVKSYDEVTRIWEECLEAKARRLIEQGLDQRQYDSSCHVIATLRVKSSNIVTGIGSFGKIQFADLAAADIVPRHSAHDVEVNSFANQSDWRFVHRSLETLSECVEARMQFDRSVPYRNSTLTHLLRDSLEGDTKVLVIACVSSDPKDIEETMATLKFVSRMRRVTIGKATKHSLNPS